MPFRSDFDPHDYDPATLLSKEASKDVFQDEPIDIAQLTRRLRQIEGATGLRGLTFVGCTIHGPAILEHPHNIAAFDDCQWEPGGMRFWVVHPTERPPDGGVIKLENCIFGGVHSDTSEYWSTRRNFSA